MSELVDDFVPVIGTRTSLLPSCLAGQGRVEGPNGRIGGAVVEEKPTLAGSQVDRETVGTRQRVPSGWIRLADPRDRSGLSVQDSYFAAQGGCDKDAMPWGFDAEKAGNETRERGGEVPRE